MYIYDPTKHYFIAVELMFDYRILVYNCSIPL